MANSFQLRNLGVLALIIVAAAGVLILRDERTGLSAEMSTAKGSEHVNSRSEPEIERSIANIPAGGAIDTSLVDAIGRARTANAAQALIKAGMVKNDPVAFDAALMLDAICVPASYAASLDTAAQRATAEYCSGYASDYSGKLSEAQLEQLQQIQNKGLSTKLSEEFDVILESEGKAAAAKEIDSLLRNGRPEEVRLALAYSAEMEIFPDAIAQQVHGLNTDTTDGRVALDVAGDLYFCRNSSACGPRGLHTLMLCAATQSCKKQVNYLDALQSMSRGSDFDAALELVKKIEEL